MRRGRLQPLVSVPCASAWIFVLLSRGEVSTIRFDRTHHHSATVSSSSPTLYYPTITRSRFLNHQLMVSLSAGGCGPFAMCKPCVCTAIHSFSVWLCRVRAAIVLRSYFISASADQSNPPVLSQPTRPHISKKSQVISSTTYHRFVPEQQ